MPTLRERLADWQDIDVAAYELGATLGVFPENDPDFENFRDRKAIFWAANPLGDALYAMLRSLVEIGVLEHNENAMSYRWNPSYEPPSV
jgi:hypothetical protein